MWEKNDEHELQKNTTGQTFLESNPKALARLVMLCTLWTIPMWEEKNMKFRSSVRRTTRLKYKLLRPDRRSQPWAEKVV
jgi:hypothetical protein